MYSRLRDIILLATVQLLIKGGTASAEPLPSPPLAMRDVQYSLTPLGEDAYAIIPDMPIRNGNGFIVGDESILVVDSILNAQKTNEMLQILRGVTNKPIRFVVNTNYNCDHVCGNAQFPRDAMIIAQRNTAALMKDYDENRALIASFMPEDEQEMLSASLTEPRMPDLIFDRMLEIDLGGRAVEVWHFGTGNTPGDTIVYDPTTKTAWVGNLLFGKSMISIFSGHGSAQTYAETLRALKDTLDLQFIVPGHMITGVENADILDDQLLYVEELTKVVARSLQSGLGENEALASAPLSSFPKPHGVGQWLNTLGSAHQLNFRTTYRAMSADRATVESNE